MASRDIRRFNNGPIGTVARSVTLIGRGLIPVIIAHLRPRRPGAKLTPGARPREQRPRRRLKTAARGDADEPPLAEIPPAKFRRAVGRSLGAA